jgi:amino acid transporter
MDAKIANGNQLCASIGTMTVAYAAMPRIVYSIARGGRFFGPLSRTFARLHPRYNTPVPAILLTFVIYQISALLSSQVIDWIYSVAYAWIILYSVFHLLAICNRILRPEKD